MPEGIGYSKHKLTPAKARMILHDKKIRGKRLTDKQRKFMGAVAGGARMRMKG